MEERLNHYIKNKYLIFSSPMLSNSKRKANKSKRSLPVSCYVNFVDNLESLINHTAETRYLAVSGGGIGCDWSKVRSVSRKSQGTIPFLHTINADMTAYKQGHTRKGLYAAYMNVDHPEIIELINMRLHGRDTNRMNNSLNHGINLSDKFMKAVENDELWDLIDPYTKLVKKSMKARDIWGEILTVRSKTGEPYLNFIDTIDNSMNEELKEKGCKIVSSNLCNEIHLPTSEERTAVCCLSSLNIDLFDEWVDSRIVEDCVTMLDNVLEDFLGRYPKELWRAKESKLDHRPIGLGATGLFSFFRRRRIDPESKEAAEFNDKIFSIIKQRSLSQSQKLGKERRFPRLLIKQRNSHLLALAPNSNSSIIIGGTPGHDPPIANVLNHSTRAGNDLLIEEHFKKLCEERGKMNDETILSIIKNNGSVSHLPFLSDHEKKVFKTAFEINQNVLINLAAQRQKYICQGQSFNLFIPPEERKEKFNELHLSAWKKGL